MTRRRLFRGLLVLGGLALIPLGYYLYRANADADRLAAVVAELDRTEPGWRLAELQERKPRVPAERNSALVIQGAKLPPPLTVLADMELVANQRLTPLQQAKFQEYLETVSKELTEARRVADLPEGRFHFTIDDDIISTLLTHVQDTREFCFSLRISAIWQAQQGNVEQAVADVRASVHAARTLRHDPFLVSHLVRLAALSEACATMERIVAQGRPPAALLEAAQKLFAGEPAMACWSEAMAGERAGMHELFQRIAQGKFDPALVRGLMGFRRRWYDGVTDRFASLSAPASHVWMLEHFTAKIAARDLPARERRARMAELREQIGEAPPLARQLMAVPYSVDFDGFTRAQAKLNATVAGLAAERFRQQHGRWPKTLDELVPKYLDAVPVDPCADAPLRYRVTKDGVLILSVGPDGTLQGDARDAPVAAGDMRLAHEFRLWNVDKRRQ